MSLVSTFSKVEPKKNASKTIILGSRKMAQCLNVLAALLDTQV